MSTSWRAGGTARSTSAPTNDLVRRAWEHRNGLIEGFTKRYNCKLLVWYEPFGDIALARRREFQMKDWRRAWKVREVEGLNPEWLDLYDRVALP